MADLKNLKVLVWGGVSYNTGWSENDFTNDLKAKLEGIAEGSQVNVIEQIVLNGQAVAVTEKSVDLGNLQKALTAGSGINISEDGTISTTLDVEAFKVVDVLPDTPAAGNESKIHVVPNAGGAEGNEYNEYLWDGSKWELLGSFKADVDLSDYAKTADVEQAISDAKDELQGEIDKKVSQTDYDAKVQDIESDVDGLRSDLGESDATAGTGSAFARIKSLEDELNSLSGGAGSIASQIEERLGTYDTETVQPLAERVTVNEQKLAGISEGANKVTSSYDEATETLTVTIE